MATDADGYTAPFADAAAANGMIDGASAFMRSLGLRLADVGPDRVTGWIDLGPDHHQPFGIVHGGVYAAVVETVASIGASIAAGAHGQTAVGVNNDTNFLRSMSAGRVDVVAEPIHQGRSQQLWEVAIRDERGRMVACGQVRLQNVTPRS